MKTISFLALAKLLVISGFILYSTVPGHLWAQVDASSDPRPIIGVQDTRTNPFIVIADGRKRFSDPFPVYWDGVWHIYTLVRTLEEVLHFTSVDLVRWTEHQPAMVGRGIATGTVIRHLDTFYMFYTDANPQTVRLVTSDNPWQFDFTQSVLVAEADGDVYKKGWFRDPYIFYNEAEQLWWMLIEARSPAVSVALFTSKDLIKWTLKDPLLVDPARKHCSCPQLFENDSSWYMTCLDYETYYYIADNPFGPWEERGQYHSKHLTAASRLVTDGGGQRAWGFFNGHITPETGGEKFFSTNTTVDERRGGYSVGRELVFNADSSIGVRPLPELITSIHNMPNNINLFDHVRELSGKWEIDSALEVVQSTDGSGGALLFDLPDKSPDYYFEADVEFTSPQAKVDIIVRTMESFEKGYRVAMEPANKKIAIRLANPGGGTFNEKNHTFIEGKTVKVQIFVFGNLMEAFIDGQASLSARIRDRSEHNLAIKITGGQAIISKPLLHYFIPHSPLAAFTGTWTAVTGDNLYHNGTAHVGQEKDATIEFTFTGNEVAWYGLTNNDLGYADVYLDGILAAENVDTYGTTRQVQKLFEKTNLINKSHTIKIIVKGEKNGASSGYGIVHDYFTYDIDLEVTSQYREPGTPPKIKINRNPNGIHMVFDSGDDYHITIYSVLGEKMVERRN